MFMKVTGLHRRDLPIIERTLWNDCTWFWLESDETFPVPQSSHFSLKSTLLIEGWRFVAELLQPVFRSTQKGDGDKRRNDPLPLPLISSSYPPSLHTPPLSRRPDQSSSIFATRPHSPEARGGIRAGGAVCWVWESIRTVRHPKSVSGDVCDESDAGLDVLPAQGARLQL